MEWNDVAWVMKIKSFLGLKLYRLGVNDVSNEFIDVTFRLQEVG